MSQEGTMPKKETEEFPSFDDWEAPFDPDEVDGEKALRLIYSIRKDEHKLKTKLKAKEEAISALETDKSELSTALDTYKDAEAKAKREGESKEDALQRQIDELTKKLTEKPETKVDDLAVARLEIALEHGLTKRQAARLVGEDREALEEDAEELVKELGLNKPADEDDDTEKAGDDENEDAVKLRRRPQTRSPGDPNPRSGPNVDYTNPENLEKVLPRGW
jgi:hypothetical protein